MKVLLLAPQPFYQERGTPIAVDLMLRALSERGDRVDLLAYHEGIDRHYENLRIYRISAFKALSNVGPGLSFKKIVCDCLFFFRMLGLALRNRYDVVHAVEEASFLAMILGVLTRTPYIVDLDSNMTQQIVDRYPSTKPLASLMRWIECLPIRRASIAVPVCERLADHVRHLLKPEDIIVLQDIALTGNGAGAPAESLRQEVGTDRFIVMYIGNLERYQGIKLLLEAFTLAHSSAPELVLAIVGGRRNDIAKLRTLAERFGIEEVCRFLGPRPLTGLGELMAQADILVSPRIGGENTPMKIYSYLDSGTPVLATALETHRQVLSEDMALLVAAAPAALAEGILALRKDPALRLRLARNAKIYVSRRHTYEVFKEVVDSIYDSIESKLASLDCPGSQPSAARRK